MGVPSLVDGIPTRAVAGFHEPPLELHSKGQEITGRQASLRCKQPDGFLITRREITQETAQCHLTDSLAGSISQRGWMADSVRRVPFVPTLNRMMEDHGKSPLPFSVRPSSVHRSGVLAGTGNFPMTPHIRNNRIDKTVKLRHAHNRSIDREAVFLHCGRGIETNDQPFRVYSDKAALRTKAVSNIPVWEVVGMEPRA